MRVLKANKLDVLTCCARAVDPVWAKHPDRWDRWATGKLSRGPAWVFMDEGRRMAVIGLEVPREGVGRVWAVFTQGDWTDRSGVLLGLIRGIRAGMDILAETYDLNRMLAFSDKAFPASQRLLRAAGFERLRHSSKTRFFYRWRYGH